MNPMTAHTSDNNSVHRPVLLTEVLAALTPGGNDIIVDSTFGAGGYSRAILEAAPCRVIAIDRDPEALSRGEGLRDAYPERLTLVRGRFGEMEALLAGEGIGSVQGVVFDLGVSSPQLDTAERGFSFRQDGPLDMRMGAEGETAADVVNTADAEELAGIIRRFGEERHARRIARAIEAARAEAPITRTLELADLVASAIPTPRRGPRGKRGAAKTIHPATRTFQALRIYVNDEIGQLRRGLEAAERLLAGGGRLAVVSFHSLEDREVKRFLRARAGLAPRPHRHSPALENTGPVPSFELLFRGVVKPADDEAAANPRARSARLRAARRTDAAPWEMEGAA